MKKDEANNQDWKDRLLAERTDVFNKWVELGKAFRSEEVKLPREEWRLLDRQYEVMGEYLHVLTRRCVYHKLIDMDYLDDFSIPSNGTCHGI